MPYCRPTGEACSSGPQCCSLVCDGGYCQNLQWCSPTFEICINDGQCCSGRCAEDLLGFKRCLPIGGCRTSGPVLTSQGQLNEYGEICADGCDCCTELCEPDASAVARCKKLGDPTCGEPGYVCLPDGELCETDCQCCSNICLEEWPPDSGGQFPKGCLAGPPGTGGGGSGGGGSGQCLPEGEECSTASECCCELCVPSDPFCGFVCKCDGGTGGGPPCVETGGQCTTSADCCYEMDCIPDGQGGLYCAVPPPN